MTNLVGDTTGLVHLISAIFALIAGTLVLTARKGTKKHKRIGYIYVASMIVMLITAFMIYRLFKGFGIFHVLGLVSIFSLVRGMYPILFRRTGNYVYMHFRFMYWSVVGLYGAFIAETMVRVPFMKMFDSSYTPTGMFYNMVGISVGLVMLLAHLYYKKQRNVWMKEFNDK